MDFVRREHRGAESRFGKVQPFEYVSEGIAAWHSGDVLKAESLLRQGLEAYRREAPREAHFALGRLGAFLVDQERFDEAEAELSEAISSSSDIPAVWFDYMRVLAHHQNVEGLFATARKAAVRLKRPAEGLGGIGPSFLLEHARRAHREGATEFGLAVARRVVDEATSAGDQTTRWTALGVVGELLERSGRLSQALELWTEAFSEGSDDLNTLNRLSMHLDREGNPEEAIDVIERALEGVLPASSEQQLRKRLERCRSRVTGSKPRPVLGFTVRTETGSWKLAYEIKATPVIRQMAVVGEHVHAFSRTRATGILTVYRLSDGAVLGSRDSLPLFPDIRFNSSGWALGIRRTAAVGHGPTLLWFVSPSGHVRKQIELPDATSEISSGDNRWYVGCRDGNLYAFGLDGKLLWRWQTPGSQNHDGDPYTRPCPYRVASDELGVVVANMTNLFRIDTRGQLCWHSSLPTHVSRTSYPMSIANPVDPEAPHNIVLTIEHGGEVASAVAAISCAGGRTLVASMGGQLYEVGPDGKVGTAHSIGRGWSTPLAISGDGSFAAGWCDQSLFVLNEGRVTNIATDTRPPTMLAFLEARELVVVTGNRVQIYSVEKAAILWGAEFANSIAGVVGAGGSFVCAGGVLALFIRTDVAPPSAPS